MTNPAAHIGCSASMYKMTPPLDSGQRSYRMHAAPSTNNGVQLKKISRPYQMQCSQISDDAAPWHWIVLLQDACRRFHVPYLASRLKRNKPPISDTVCLMDTLYLRWAAYIADTDHVSDYAVPWQWKTAFEDTVKCPNFSHRHNFSQNWQCNLTLACVGGGGRMDPPRFFENNSRIYWPITAKLPVPSF